MHAEGFKKGFTIVQLLVVVFLFIVVLAFLIPTTRRVRGEGSGRVKCQSNLSQIGKALLLYSNENKGAFPRTIAVLDAPISITNDGYDDVNPFALETKRTPGKTNNIPAAMWMLVRTQDLTTEVFTCPYSTAEKDLMNNLAATQRGNFSGDPKTGKVTKNVSYSFVNVYPGSAAIEKKYKTFITAFSSDFAIASDLSPMTPDDPTWQTIKVGVPRAVMIKGNAKNHDQDGQNVLYADGHAEFQQTPLAGTQNDNIFTVNAVEKDGNLSLVGASATGVEPAHPADSVLLINE